MSKANRGEAPISFFARLIVRRICLNHHHQSGAAASVAIRSGCDARRNGVRPLSVAQTLEHFGAPQVQARIARERDALADRVVELDR